jgi:peptidoglycan/xylan/chitin deacetylase (PgdA/CDA1 family)
VSNKLIENGWLFANHSYTHNRTGFWGPESNPNNIRNDVRRWRERMEPIIGQTNLFIAPFGFTLRGEGMQIILDNGYDIYCNVDFQQRIYVHPTHVLMGRIEIGGYALVRWATTLTRDFFDVATVIDPHRPPIISQ